MGLSDTEIAARLASLRRQREALDREIADLVLYQELGRRLAATGAGAETPGPETGPLTEPIRAPAPAPEPVTVRGVGGAAPAASLAASPAASLAASLAASPAASPSPGRSDIRAAPAIPPAIAFAEDAAGARRYGRALVGAACAALAQAGRPLHAAEILDVLGGQGFTLPGRDPVAALNTRLWKRAGPGGPLRRVGEATYALAETDRPPA